MWKTFWFDGNLYAGEIDSPEKWAECRKAYLTGGFTVYELLEVRANKYRDIEIKPFFGFGPAFSGDFTLGQWAGKNGVDLI